jgi:ABC-type branched-subunit amino acid transport system ATPase component
MQAVATDPLATGREQLELAGRLHRVPRAQLRRRVDELLALMGLADVAGRYAGTYSGGMRRRLDLASALVHRPTVLFLDATDRGPRPAEPHRTVGRTWGAGAAASERATRMVALGDGRVPSGIAREDHG